MPSKDSKPKKTRCPAGSRRNTDTGRCIKKTNVAEKNTAPTKAKKKATAATKPKASKSSSKSKGAALPKEVKETVRKVTEFSELYKEEGPMLAANVRGGHKKGVLNKLFTSAKNALSSLVRLIRSPYFIIFICVALAVYTGMSPAAGKTMAVNAFNTLKTSTFGQYFASSMTSIPAKFASAKEFVAATWSELWMYKGVGEFFNTMGGFMGQAGALLQTSREALGTKWTLMIGSMQKMYDKILEYAKNIPAMYSKATSTTLGPVYTSPGAEMMSSLGSSMSSAASRVRSFLTYPITTNPATLFAGSYISGRIGDKMTAKKRARNRKEVFKAGFAAGAQVQESKARKAAAKKI